MVCKPSPASRMHATTPVSARRPLVRAWLYAVAALMVLTLVVGGATRLTESGLSIVEWKPVTGVLPPLSRGGLAGRVRQVPADPAIPRAQPRHEPRPVQDHLLVGVEPPAAGAAGRRGVPAAVPALSLARLDRAALCSCGCGRCSAPARCSGAVGWWMVSSGLAGRVSVSQYRLGLPPDARLRDLRGDPVDRARPRRRAAGAGAAPAARARRSALVVLVLLQIYLGALVAGLDAGLIYNTWPLDRRRADPVGRAAVVRDAAAGATCSRTR